MNFTQLTDQELLYLIQKGNESAFKALYDKYYIPLFKKAFLRLHAQLIVEEVVQDVFLNLWQTAPALDTTGNVRAYLYATLRNMVLYRLRTEANRRFYQKKAEELTHSKKEAAVLPQLYLQETEHHINQVISQLPPKCKQAYLLSRKEQLSYKEIAEQMNLSVSTVEKHISKALNTLRKALQEWGDVAFIILLIISVIL